tara:strand:- start:119 stop:436 length:318 start_codon:yes stop_codon:yes gene_type:complete
MPKAITSTYKFPLGADTGGAVQERLPLLGKSRLGPFYGFVVAALLTVAGLGALIGVAASLANPPDGGHGDAEGGLIAALIIVILLFVACLVSFVLNGLHWWSNRS